MGDGGCPHFLGPQVRRRAGEWADRWDGALGDRDAGLPQLRLCSGLAPQFWVLGCSGGPSLRHHPVWVGSLLWLCWGGAWALGCCLWARGSELLPSAPPTRWLCEEAGAAVACPQLAWLRLGPTCAPRPGPAAVAAPVTHGDRQAASCSSWGAQRSCRKAACAADPAPKPQAPELLRLQLPPRSLAFTQPPSLHPPVLDPPGVYTVGWEGDSDVLILLMAYECMCVCMYVHI